MKNLLLLSLTFAVLIFTSCQEEAIDITEASQENEIFVARSEVATLMKQTSTNDGSADNIIDRANCFSIILPVTVLANTKEVIVNSEEDYQEIETIFDASDEDEDALTITFPITIILGDYSEIIIQNQSELEQYKNLCNGEDEEDDDIECIDFQYPISYSVFDTDKNLINTVKIRGDREMYRFIHNLVEKDIVSINFPVSLIFSDNTTIIVNNLFELKENLKRAINFCDEDDDNDYGDDDFTKERLDNLLVMCPWIVNNVHRNNNSLSDNYREYLMRFKEDGTVKVRARNGDIITGFWTTRLTDRGAMIKLEFDSFVDFTLEWVVYDSNKGRIKLFTTGGNHIILEKNCDILFDQTIDRIKNILQECHWRIARLRIDGMIREGKYIGTPLKFKENGTVNLRIHGDFVSGTWEILKANAGFVLQIGFENRPDLNLRWLITILDNNKVNLENQNSEMILKKICPDDYVNIKSILNTGKWQVTSYIEGDINKTENYRGFIIDFLENGGIYIEGNGQIIDGSWLPYRNNNMPFLGLNFGLEPPFDELNNRWKITDLGMNKIALESLDDTGTTTNKLILEKI